MKTLAPLWMFALAGLLAGCSDHGLRPLDPADDDASVNDDDDTPADDDDTPAAGPSLVIDPQGFGFGDRPMGCPAEVVVTLANVGDEQLLLHEVLLEEASDGGELTLVESPEGAVLDAGEALEVTVVHNPANQTPDEAVLRVLSNDTEMPEQTAAFTGGALPAEQASDAWLQENSRSVDVLWIVDNSCSMGLEQEALWRSAGSDSGSSVNWGV